MNIRRTETDWAGVALGLAVASLAAFQMLKLAPALPVMIADYGYSRVLAGAMMSVYAVAALLLSLATLAGLAAVLVERWLFFAEARHMVTLYYGAKEV